MISNMLDNEGKVLDANFSIGSDDSGLRVVLESRSAGRNDDYSVALALILGRLGELGAVLDSIHLERARKEARPEFERRVQPKGIRLPLDLATVDDFDELRRRISAAQATLGSKQGAAGAGNGTKRIRMRLGGLNIDPVELRARVHGFSVVAVDSSVSRRPLSVTSREAVLAAVAEFDRMGRADFLKKYGYREAVSYFLLHEGRRYDTKPIIGSAFGHQHRLPPLANDEFSGGKAAVQKALSRMGFQVETTKELARPRRGVSSEDRTRQIGGQFAILATPNVYDIERAIHTLKFDTWALPSGSVRIGEKIIVWKAQGRSERRGVVALGEVIEEAQYRLPHPGSEEFFVGESMAGPALRFLLRYDVPAGLPLWLGTSEETDAVLKSLSVSRAQGGRRYKVTEKQWQRVWELAGAESRGLGPLNVRRGMRLVPVETATRERFLVAPPGSVSRLAMRAESVLVDEFKQWLNAKGVDAWSALYDIPDATLRSDLFIPHWNLLVEAKASNRRDDIRTAIGQLFDYRRFHQPEPELAVLVPSEPECDLLELLHGLNFQVWFKDDNKFVKKQ